MQDQIGRQLVISDLRFQDRAARSKLPGRSLDPNSNVWARGMIATSISDFRSGRLEEDLRSEI